MKSKVCRQTLLLAAWVAFMAATIHGQQKQTPITGTERTEMFELLGKYKDDHTEFVKKQGEVQEKINSSKLGMERQELVDKLAAKDLEIKNSPYGKELDEINASIKKANEDVMAAVGKHLEAHGAKGCGLTDNLQIVNCPVDKK